MTICVAIQVNDCLVFAADSASSMVGQDEAGKPQVTNVYNHGKKVFSLRKGLPIMAMTCGMGNIGGSSVDILAKELRALLTHETGWAIDPDKYSIEEVCGKAHRYFYDEQYQKDENRPKGDHSFELFVGGISSGERLGEVWKISVINGQTSGPVCFSPRGQFGVIWAGQPEALNRLIVGYSGLVPQVLSDAGIKEDQLTPLMEAMRSKTQAALTHPAMPVQDAIDLADFLVNLTIGFTRFLPGANTVGGAVDVATVTRHEGFKWIRRKHYYPAHLNPLETGHVGEP
jgi:hypothetical protein